MAKKSKKKVLVEVKHKCGQIIGYFGACDDNGSVDVRCEKCGKLVSVYNACLSALEDVLTSPEDEPQMIENPHEEDGCVFTAMRVLVK